MSPSNPAPPLETEDGSSLLDRLIPPGVQKFFGGLPGVSSMAKLPAERRDLIAIALLAAAVFLPYLGAVGLWDPWEPHYGEVAREMVWRHDYVYPFWFKAYFFSKPVLLMWLMTLGMNVVGINDNPVHSPLPVYTEWAMRLPVALLAIAGLVILCLAIHRIFGRRMAFLTAFVLMTSPFYFFLARQCMEDMPLVACVEIALGAFLLAEFSEKPGAPGEKASPIWWYVMYAFAGFATLAKESLGIVLPGLVIFTYLLVSADWKLLKRARLLPGLLTFLAIAGPWYLTLILFRGHDDEWSTFAARLAHDNTDRFFAQVHTTTPAWTFSYFIDQLGWGFFPWIALIPGAMVALGKLNRASKDPQTRATIFFAGWAIAIFVFFTFSGTKFHHYIFPAVPALAFCVAYFIDKLWREGIDRWAITLLGGGGLLALVAANLYTWHDVSGPPHSGLRHFVDLFTYNYTRPYPYGLNRPDIFATLCVLGGGIAALALLARKKSLMFGAFAAFALATSIWGSWFFWRAMAPHWSQRDEFWALYGERKPNEPITGYILGEGWRGETFYGRNTLDEINDPRHLIQFLSQPGPEYVIVEQARYGNMRQVLDKRFSLRIVDQSSNKFYLVEVTKADEG